MDEKEEFVCDQEEERHFRRIVRSFKAYHCSASKRVARSLDCFRRLPSRQREFLPEFEANCQQVLSCVDQNYEIIRNLVEGVEEMFVNAQHSTENDEDNYDTEVDHKLALDLDRVYTTIKQVVRDWTVEGAAERNSSYARILTDLNSLFPNRKKGEDAPNILVPGSGLGRLAFEIARLGFKCQGNEISLHMLITSNFILNKCTEKEQFTLYPYVHNWCNNLSFNDQVRPVKFPDVSPYDFLNELSQFSMAAGDFLEIYNEPHTARNVIDYIEKIWSILRQGGYWLNFGPLLYHFSDVSSEDSIELSYEQLKKCIEKVGFKFLKEETKIDSKYLDVKHSMLRYNYQCVYFTVQKPHSI